MSKEIQITLYHRGMQKKLSHSADNAVLVTLREAGINNSFCGGSGSCGSCRIRFLNGAPLPGHGDRRHFTPEELREGYRLACTAKPQTDCILETHFTAEPPMDTVVDYQAGEQKSEETFIAVDIGTTTVAMQKIEQGRIAGTYTFLNPQRSYGTDVLSRIQAAKVQGAALRTLLLTELKKGMEQLEREGRAAFLVIAGNTPMLHILMGYDVSGLGREPFLPVNIQFLETVILDRKTYILPGISAFLGADTVAGMYFLGFHKSEKIKLLIDLGTNGEIVLGNQDKRIGTATAAGPAFEGGGDNGIYGADLIALSARLLAEKKMDKEGLLMEPYFESGIQLESACITQEHIRKLQMAKGAVRAGIEVLFREAELMWEQVEEVFVAGGLGSYLDIEAAFAIGLLPKELAGKVKAAGNTALAGSVLYGAVKERKEIEELAAGTIALNLAHCEQFQPLFYKNMSF